MAGFSSVLFCVTEDGDTAVRYVARLAVATRAHLTVADVMEDIPPIVRRLLPPSWNLPALVRAQKQARLEKTAAVAQRLGTRPATVLLTGSPIKALVREVDRGGHDLLAVDATASGAVESVGASAARLLREAPCPVLLVRPSQRRRRSRILVAIDTGPWLSKSNTTLATKLIEHGVWLARKNDAELHVLHAWIPYGERMIIRAGLTEAESRRFLVSIRTEVSEEVSRTLAPFHSHIDPSRVHLVKGDPRTVIADFATDRRIDMLVIGTVGRSGVAGRIIGNTAEAVMTQLPCSMLVVKPDNGRSEGRRRTRP